MSLPDQRSEHILQSVEGSIGAKRAFFEANLRRVEEVADLITDCLQGGGKLLIFGNGGSAADAQHLAAELVNRFSEPRRALAAIALTTDTSILTSIANDEDFRQVFSRQIEALGRPGDLAVAISTSGNSPNVLSGLRSARDHGLRSVAFLGKDGGEAKSLADLALVVDSLSTARIQEVHITLCHILCELIESTLSGQPGR